MFRENKYIMITDVDTRHNQLALVDSNKLLKHFNSHLSFKKPFHEYYSWLSPNQNDLMTKLQSCIFTLNQISRIESTKMDIHMYDFSSCLIVPLNFVFNLSNHSLKYDIDAFRWALITKGGRSLNYYGLINSKALSKKSISKYTTVNHLKLIVPDDMKLIQYMQFATTHYAIILGKHVKPVKSNSVFAHPNFYNKHIKLDVAVKNNFDKVYYQHSDDWSGFFNNYSHEIKAKDKIKGIQKNITLAKIAHHKNYGFTWSEVENWSSNYISNDNIPTRHRPCFIKMYLVPYLNNGFVTDMLKITDATEDLVKFSSFGDFKNDDMSHLILQQLENSWD